MRFIHPAQVSTALAVALMLSAPAFAENHAKPADAPAIMKEKGDRHHGKRAFIPMEDGEMSKVEKMSAEERDAFFKERRKEFRNMSPEDRKALREKRKEWFEGLPADKKEALKERHKKLHEEFKARKKAEFDKLSPEEKEKIKERRRQHHEDMKDGDHPKPPHKGKDRPPHDDADDE